jgi:hypothetical protein
MLKNFLSPFQKNIIYGKKILFPIAGETGVAMCDSMCEESRQGLDREEELLVPSRKPSSRRQSSHQITTCLTRLARAAEYARQKIEEEE